MESIYLTYRMKKRRTDGHGIILRPRKSLFSSYDNRIALSFVDSRGSWSVSESCSINLSTHKRYYIIQLDVFIPKCRSLFVLNFYRFYSEQQVSRIVILLPKEELCFETEIEYEYTCNRSRNQVEVSTHIQNATLSKTYGQLS